MPNITNMPSHAWTSITYAFFLTTLASVSVTGLVLGYPEVLWVWALLLAGWESDCNCHDCRGETPPEEREDAETTLKRRYVQNEITDEELESALKRVSQIEDADHSELQRQLN